MQDSPAVGLEQRSRALRIARVVCVLALVPGLLLGVSAVFIVGTSGAQTQPFDWTLVALMTGLLVATVGAGLYVSTLGALNGRRYQVSAPVAYAIAACTGFSVVAFSTSLGFILALVTGRLWPYLLSWLLVVPALWWVWPRASRIAAVQAALDGAAASDARAAADPSRARSRSRGAVIALAIGYPLALVLSLLLARAPIELLTLWRASGVAAWARAGVIAVVFALLAASLCGLSAYFSHDVSPRVALRVAYTWTAVGFVATLLGVIVTRPSPLVLALVMSSVWFASGLAGFWWGLRLSARRRTRGGTERPIEQAHRADAAR